MTEILLITFAALLRIVSNPLANVFQKQLITKGNHPLLVNFLTYLILSIFCVFLALGVNWGSLSTEFWIYSVLGGIFGALGNGFLIRALEKGDLSVLGPVNSYKSVVGIIFGVFLLREVPSFWGMFGILLIIYGSYFVLDATEDRFSWALLKRKEIQYRIWAMILTAIEAVFDKKVVLASTPVISFISWCWFGALFSFILLFIYKLPIKREIQKSTLADLKKYMFLIACMGIMQLTTNYVFNNMAVGYALSLFQLSTIVSVFLGYKIFKEQDIKQKLIGALIMVVGSVLIVLLKGD